MSDLKIGNRAFAITPEREAYAQLRRKYLENAYSQRASFLADFSQSFGDADELFSDFPAYLEDVVQEATEAALSDITARQIFDVDERVFGERFASHLSGRETRFDQLYSKYQAIVLSAAELQAYREERAANRSEIIGGGFGVEGAMKGMVFAAVANTALGMVHGLVNAADNAASTAEDKRKKAELFDDPTTRNGFADVVFDTAFRAHLAVAELINEREDAAPFALISAEEEAKASALLNNIAKGRVPAEAQADVLFEALSHNPFAKEIWFEWLSRFGDKDGSIALAANDVGIVEFESRKRELIADWLAALPAGTPAECRAGIEALEEYASFLGITVHAEREALQEKARQLDTERRSFRGEVYSTAKKAEIAAQEWERTKLERIAAEMSDDEFTIQRDGTRLIVTHHASEMMPWYDADYAVGQILKREVRKRRSPTKKWLVIGLIVGGIALLLSGGLGLVILATVLIVWWRITVRHQNELRTNYPEIFGQPSLPNPQT